MDTNGWDIVFAADIGVINKSLQSNTASLIETFDFNEQGYDVKGTFGTWSIAAGGSGKNLALNIELKSGLLTPPGQSSIDITGLIVQLVVALQLLPSPSSPGGQTLTFNFKSVGNSPSADNGIVTPNGVIDPDHRLTLLQESAVGMAVATCLVNNASKVSYVFANITPSAANGTPWLMPHQSSYCYAPVIGGGASLAILSMTSDGPSNAPLKVDPSLLGQPGDAGLAIAPWIFLRNVFVPGLANAWGVAASLFSVDNNGHLSNTGTIGLPSVSKAGETYYPKINSLTASVQADHVALSVSGSCDMGMNISMTFNGSSNIGIQFDPVSQKISMTVLGTPTFSKNVDIPWYDHLLDIISVGVAEIVLQVTTNVIGNELGNGISQMTGASNISSASSNIVSWGGRGGFSPNAAGLSGALWLKGPVK